jgi:hypothetical protein
VIGHLALNVRKITFDQSPSSITVPLNKPGNSKSFSQFHPTSKPATGNPPPTLKETTAYLIFFSE